MREFDSSKTRVAPVFTRLLKRDPRGDSWLPALLRLPRRFDDVKVDVPARPGRIVTCAWYPEEKRLAPPPALLRTLVDRPALLSREGLTSSRAATLVKRTQLLGGDAATRAEALALVKDAPSKQGWHVFEGPTSVDAYIEAERAVVLIEGKRTETGPTTNTTRMATRHQLLRTLDAAWDMPGKQAYGFFIVEGEDQSTEVPSKWQTFAPQTVSTEALERSLPHREPGDRAAIARAFLGVTTWQAVCEAFDIPFRKLG